jgi:hypothetical protein
MILLKTQIAMGALHYNMDGHVVLPVSDLPKGRLKDFQ